MSKHILALLTVLLLSACGNKGALYLPQDALPSDPETITTAN
ncbi:lipoprotein [Rhodanobacter aciditrophus]|uniref:Lipoprotein n=1 Tax=Rhodanobacter aciditrophus TaxID=1623218 RepID=A0ABW4B2L9_9GAMM